MSPWRSAGSEPVCRLLLPRGDDDPARPRNGYPLAYAIKDAKIIAAPGKVHDPGTIVVRRELIEAVGPAKDVVVPFDAEVIDGKGLTVYPGFIDLFSTAGQRPGVERSATGAGGRWTWPNRRWPRRRTTIAGG